MTPSLHSRVRGCVMGAAIGDALGHPTEFLRSFEDIYQTYGPDGVKGYELFWERDGHRFAPYTDDTQMAELVLRTFTWARMEGAELARAMRYLAKRFLVWSLQPQGGHRAPGHACLAGCRMLAAGEPWDTAGDEAAGGCGSVMRAYPAGLLFYDDLEKAEAWAVAQSLPTHRAPLALAASAALAHGVALCLRGSPLDVVFSSMIERATTHDTATAELIEQARSDARNGKTPASVLQELEGWAAHECIAAAVYVCARHEDSLPQALLEAANTPGDSDSIATLVGALLGAHLGVDALPENWVADVERSGELLALADEACAALE